MFEYFRGNYPWNLAVSMCLNCGGNISEVDEACRPLVTESQRDDADAVEAFFQAFTRLGDRLSSLAHADEQSGNEPAASRKYLRAANYYMTGERIASWHNARKFDVYRRMKACYAKGIHLGELPVEFVEIPYGDSSLPALFMPGIGEGARPCMIHFDGLDVMKELIHLSGVADDFRRRGISTLIVDHPGVGEALRLRGLKGMPETERPAGASVDYLQTRADVNADRIGIMALSLGGYYAPRAAAFEKRLKCCVAWGAIWDWHERVKSRAEGRGGERSVSNFFEHVGFVFGVETVEEILERTCGFTLNGVADKITCPLLVTHGENDRQVPLSTAVKTIEEAINAPVKELKTFTLAEGGAEHCSADNFSMNHDYAVNWAAKILLG